MLAFRNNPIRTIVLKERFDTKDVNRLMLSDHLDREGVAVLNKYVNKLDGDEVEVEYTSKELGRLDAKMTNLKKNERCYTQMRLYNVMKAVGCRDIYTDLDIKSCHPTLLTQLFEHEGLDTSLLRRYVEDRESLMKEMGIDKKSMKSLLFGLIYSSGKFKLEDWLAEHAIDALPPLMNEMTSEVERNAKHVIDKFPEYRDLATKRKQPDYWNLDGSALSYLAQQMEKTCLLSMYDYMAEHGWTVGALIHDGMHVEGTIGSKVMRECEAFIEERTGFKITLETKEFDCIDLNDVHMVRDDKEACDIVLEKLPKFSHDLVHSKGRRYFRKDNIYHMDASKDAASLHDSESVGGSDVEHETSAQSKNDLDA